VILSSVAAGNVDLVRHGLEAFDRRDRAAWLALRDEHCEVVPAAVWPEVQTIHGSAAAWDFYIEATEAFAPYSVSNAEIVEAGTDKVLTHHKHRLRGRTSGAEIDFDYWVVVTLRDGKVVRDEWFTDAQAALRSC
jgi:ketosteroid isomerase-like protein